MPIHFATEGVNLFLSYLQVEQPRQTQHSQKQEDIVDGALLENLMLNGQKNGEKPIKTDITHIPDNEFDELD